MYAIKIANIRKSKKHTHTLSGTAELIEGIVDFDKGAVLLIHSIDTWASIGLTAAEAEAGGAKVPTNFPIYVELAPDSRVIYMDAETGGEVSIVQVN